MGVPGLWNIVRKAAPGDVVPLHEVNSDWVRQHGRPMRVAIDTPFAIYQFSSTTRKAENAGGMNHSTRTIYQTTLHLIRAGIQPVFVFDGPKKPPKLGRLSAVHSRRYEPYEPSRPSERQPAEIEQEHSFEHINYLSKHIFDLLGIPWRNAPGEAEAECVELEKAALVDAVLTTDGDAFVFGSRLVLEKHNSVKQNAMVRVYRMEDIEKQRDPSTILTHKHFLQLALMSGGDYHPGIPNCGPSTAIKAARIKNSCYILRAKLQRGDDLALWRKALVDGLHSIGQNAVASAVPAGFPRLDVARYYTNPIVSEQDVLKLWASKRDWNASIKVHELRVFTSTYFDWRTAHYTGKFVRTLAGSMLVRELMVCYHGGHDGSHLITSIKAKRGGEDTVSLKIGYYPSTLIDIDPAEDMEDPNHRGNLKNEVFNPHKEATEAVPRWLVQKAAPTKYRAWEQQDHLRKKRKSNTVADNGPKRPRGRPRKSEATSDTTEVTGLRQPRGRPPLSEETMKTDKIQDQERGNPPKRPFRYPVLEGSSPLNGSSDSESALGSCNKRSQGIIGPPINGGNSPEVIDLTSD